MAMQITIAVKRNVEATVETTISIAEGDPWPERELWNKAAALAAIWLEEQHPLDVEEKAALEALAEKSRADALSGDALLAEGRRIAEKYRCKRVSFG